VTDLTEEDHAVEALVVDRAEEPFGKGDEIGAAGNPSKL
jgi:hypothetical protein